jgi:Bardet-Biedl syndrome 1 protein
LLIKILKRTATLTEKDALAGPPEAQMKKLDVPKKTKLYVDQTTRERDNAIGIITVRRIVGLIRDECIVFIVFFKAMHQTFQKELFRFRIKTAKEFLRTITLASTPVSTNPNEPLKINAQVRKYI